MKQSDITQGQLEGILNAGDFGSPAAQLSKSAERILDARYLLRDRAGKVIETPRQLFGRVARALAEVERKWPTGSNDTDRQVEESSRQFFELMSTLRFLPNSPTLMNAGKPKGQLGACFVLPLEDDLGAIFSSLRDAMVIHKTGGGTGFSFGRIRPKGDAISDCAGTASGPVEFLRVFDSATQTIKQGGVRRGANMAVLPVSHPAIEEFVGCKKDGGITNFNLSVGISDAFMTAVEGGLKWELVNPRTGEVTGAIPARRLWQDVAEAAWSCGDPGILFLDRINRDNPLPAEGNFECTNPCGEQPLRPFESCILGSVNLVSYLDGEDLAWEELERDIAVAVRLLDNAIDANWYPTSELKSAAFASRKIGIGVMGWADVLMAWEIAYDSEEAMSRAEKVIRRFSAAAVKASEELAEIRGAFPGFGESKWKSEGRPPRRNATVTTIAPTGTISIFAGVSSGIEPVYSLAYRREGASGEEIAFIHPAVKRVLRELNIRSRKVVTRLLEQGSAQGLSELSSNKAKWLKTALEISPKWHVLMQAAFQKHVENGVSKTINLPMSATARDVRRVFEEAYKHGCKGITVYRDLSKPSQVLKRGFDLGRKRKELVDAVDWLLDDELDKKSTRKKVAVGLASLSRAQLRKKE